MNTLFTSSYGRLALLIASLWLIPATFASAQTGPPPWERTEARTDCAEFELTRTPFFGETHIHTSFSADAVINGTTNDPRDAYAYAQGAALPMTPSNATTTHQLQRALDFAVVTDHAEFFGETSICQSPGHPEYGAPQCVEMRSEIGVHFDSPLDSNSFLTFFNPTNAPDVPRFAFCGASDAVCLAETSLVWLDVQAAAEENYDRSDACAFTTFVGYEWTGNTSFTNLHRNVIFRNENVPALPTTYFEEPTAEGLWNALQTGCLDGVVGCDVVAIPHNSNLSGAGIFLLENDDSSPIGASDAALRARMEPVVEIMQHKGESECHPLFSPADELCGHEKVDQGSLFPGFPHQSLNYTRQVLMEGLLQEQALGVNPFKFGVIGSTDGHMGTAGATREDDYPGHVGEFDATPEWKLLDQTTFHAGANPGGLAVIWAEENSRDAMFAAMRRREVYATSGKRPIVRFFAGNPKGDPCTDGTLVDQGYRTGVPMGGEVGAFRAKKSPVFSVLAMMDPGAPSDTPVPLQRVEIIKGWVDDSGVAQEKVFQVAGDPDNGATVDEATCTPDPGTGGFDQLCAVWEDPEFSVSQRAVYYARVVDNPTCRWTTYECNAAGVDCGVPTIPAGMEVCCDPELPRTVQERAWSSPIWYHPESFGKFKAAVKVKGDSADTLKLKSSFQKVAPQLNPTDNDLTLSLVDDDVVYSVTIPAGTMEEKKAGTSWRLIDKTGAVGGISKASLKINGKGNVKFGLKTIKMDLPNANLSDHFVHTTLRAADFVAEHTRMWTAKGTSLKARN